MDYGSRGLREGKGNRVKYLKRGWNGKEGRGYNDFKKGGPVGSRGGYLKRAGGWNPLMNYGQATKINMQGCWSFTCYFS